MLLELELQNQEKEQLYNLQEFINLKEGWKAWQQRIMYGK